MKWCITEHSDNDKTGSMLVTTSGKDSCPDTCPLKGNGCYADNFPLSIHWNKVTSGERGTDWQSFCDALYMSGAKHIRYWQAGDFPGRDNQLDIHSMVEIAAANRRRESIAYTHYPVVDHKHAWHNATIIMAAIKCGLTINASTQTPAEADEVLRERGGRIPAVTLLPSDAKGKQHTPNGVPIAVCPAVKNKKIKCADCMLCARADRDFVIGFPVHGTRRKAAEALATA